MGSMRITSAPSWAKCNPHDGAAMNDAASTTRRPLRTSGIRRDRCEFGKAPAQELAVGAPRQGVDEEDLLRLLVGGEAASRVFDDRLGARHRTLAPHDI